jgi:hypothetical protein
VSGETTTYDFSINAGRDFAKEFTLTGSDGVTPRDLSLYTAISQLRTVGRAAKLSAVFTCVTVAAEGRVQMVLPAGTSATLRPGPYRYDLILATADGLEVEPVVIGEATVVGTVSSLTESTVTPVGVPTSVHVGPTPPTFAIPGTVFQITPEGHTAILTEALGWTPLFPATDNRAVEVGNA